MESSNELAEFMKKSERLKQPKVARFEWVLDHHPEESRSHNEPRPGDPCPKCGQAVLEYDGLLNLACPNCGYAVGGCFT